METDLTYETPHDWICGGCDAVVLAGVLRVGSAFTRPGEIEMDVVVVECGKTRMKVLSVRHTCGQRRTMQTLRVQASDVAGPELPTDLALLTRTVSEALESDWEYGDPGVGPLVQPITPGFGLSSRLAASTAPRVARALMRTGWRHSTD